MVQFHVHGLDLRIESVRSADVRDMIRAGGDTAETLADDIDGPNVEAVVARIDGAAVGCIVLVDRINHGVLRHLFVRDDLRGSGIGTALVSELERAAGDLGLSRIWLRPEDGRRLGRRASALGYVPVPREGAEGWLMKDII